MMTDCRHPFHSSVYCAVFGSLCYFLLSLSLSCFAVIYNVRTERKHAAFSLRVSVILLNIVIIPFFRKNPMRLCLGGIAESLWYPQWIPMSLLIDIPMSSVEEPHPKSLPAFDLFLWQSFWLVWVGLPSWLRILNILCVFVCVWQCQFHFISWNLFSFHLPTYWLAVWLAFCILFLDIYFLSDKYYYSYLSIDRSSKAFYPCLLFSVWNNCFCVCLFVWRFLLQPWLS